jgi:ABC-type multidrug transport system fused ATPase/permease subunit
MSMVGRGRNLAPKDTGPKAKFSQLTPYLLEHKPALVIAVILSLIGAVVSLAQPLVVGQVITAVQEGQDVTQLATFLVVIIFGAGVASGLMYYVLAKAGEGVVLSARNKLAVRLLKLPILEYDLRRTGDLVSRVGSDTTLLRAVLTQGLIDAAGGVLIFVGAIIAMAFIDPFLLLLTLGMISVAVISIVISARQIRSATTKAQQRVGEMAAAVERALSAVRTIRAARAESRETENISKDANEAYVQGVKIAKINALISPIAGVASNAAFIVVIGVGGFRVAAGETEVADLVTFILLMFLMIRPLGQAFGAYSSVMSALGALARIEEILQLPLEESAKESALTAKPKKTQNALEFKKVNFSYPSTEDFRDGKPVINNVSFKIKKGDRVALVGPSGSGKSTILSLIERFYEPDSGEILLEGVPVRGLARDTLRSQIGYVEQEAPVLAGSIRANLLIGSPDATDAELKKVLGQVNLTSVLKRDKRGLDAEVGEAGIMLSGGERQRLAIARALLEAPPILLLDESTSALDGLNEQRMREAIDAVAEGRTMIVIAHRLSTVVDSDQIIVLDQGKVVGIGTHSQLVKSTPLYKQLAKQQLLV